MYNLKDALFRKRIVGAHGQKNPLRSKFEGRSSPMSRHEVTMTNRRVALVIGASRGIGRQVAIDLAKNDYAGEFGCVRMFD